MSCIHGKLNNVEIYGDGENWCHRKIFNKDGTLIDDDFECSDDCQDCGYWNKDDDSED